MANFWSRWKKPWTRSQLKRRYVEGPEIYLKQIAKDSGVSVGSVERWSTQDEWVKARKQFANSVELAKIQLVVDKPQREAVEISDYYIQSREESTVGIFDELPKQVLRNRAVNQLFLDYACAIIESKIENLNELFKLPFKERVEGINLYHKAQEINYWSMVAERATSAINATMGISYYMDINAAAKKLHEHGYGIVKLADNNNDS